MKLPISPRLLACCDFVSPGDRIADIGCDHGYLSIYLLTQGIARSAIASDLREGPLQSAIANAEKYGVRDTIRFYLSDGVRSIPRDFDTLICAGMGAHTMISILDSAPWLKSSQYRMILQCQNKTHLLRQYLSDHGWRITEESVLRDGRFLYTIMEVHYQTEAAALTAGGRYIPPAMLENPGAETAAYYQWIIRKLANTIAARGESADESLSQALLELESLPNRAGLEFLKEVQP